MVVNKTEFSRSFKLKILIFIGFGPIVFSEIKTFDSIFYIEGNKIERGTDLIPSHVSGKNYSDNRTFTKIVPDFIVNEGCGYSGSDQLRINIALDDEGNYLCIWIEKRLGIREIIGQLFNQEDERIGGIIHIDDDHTEWNYHLGITYNSISKEYIVTWPDAHLIKLQRIAKTGEKVGSNISVSTTNRTNTNNPTPVIGPSGEVLVSWIGDNQGLGNSQQICRIFTKDFVPVTDEIQLINEQYKRSNAIGWNKTAATDSIGNCIVTWSSYRNGISRIVLQGINFNGELTGPNIEVSDSSNTFDSTFPVITSTNDGNYIIIWRTPNGLLGRLYNNTTGFITPQFDINQEGYGLRLYSVNTDNEQFYITFNTDELYGKIISKDGGFIGPNTALPVETYPQVFFPKISRIRNHVFYLVFFGYTRRNTDVSVQKFNDDFTKISDSFSVMDDSCSSWQTKPTVKYNQYGQSIITWEDKRYGNSNLFCQVYDAENNPVSENISINDTTENSFASTLGIVTDHDGNFIVLTLFGSYNNRNFTLVKISPGGLKIKGPVAFTDYHNNYYNSDGTIQINDSGELIVSWYRKNPYSPCYIQKYDLDFNPISTPIEILQGESSNYQKIYSLSASPQFDIFAAWVDYNGENSEEGKILKGQVFSEDGDPKSEIFILDEIPENRYYRVVDSRADDNSFACIWFEGNYYYWNLNTWRNYFTRCKNTFENTKSISSYDPNPKIIEFSQRKILVAWNEGSNVESVFYNDNTETKDMISLHTFDPYLNWRKPFNSYSASIYNDKLQFCFESVPIPEKGFDIYSNIQLLESINFDSVTCFTSDAYIPGATATFYNIVFPLYPNPANNEITFLYKLVYKSKVKISLLNLLGEELEVRDYGYKDSGFYTDRFKTNDLPAGIYFVRLHGREPVTKKVIVIK